MKKHMKDTTLVTCNRQKKREKSNTARMTNIKA
jgi:hypothetical protein